MKKCSKMKISFLMLILLLGLFLTNEKVNASTATLGWSGASEVTAGSSFKEDIVVTGIDGRIMGIGGTVSSADNSCVEFISIDLVDAGSDAENDKFTYLTMSGTNKNFTVVKVNLKAGTSPCTTTIDITGPTLSFTDGNNIKPGTISKTISVIEAVVTPPKSSDATLKNLIPDKGSLSPEFSSGTTSYTIDVSKEIEQINFTAEVNDNKASIQSGKTCNLSGTQTTCKIVVKAENGTTKTYIVTVNRPEEPNENDPEDKDPVDPPTKADATLKSLDVSGFTLNPIFKSDVTNYTITVPNNIDGLNVEAIANDPDATVKIEGNLGWKDGINPITITVTATDGTKKVYTVNANRKSLNNPSNKVEDPKSSDNFLKNLIISDGNLNPNFDKNTSNYSIKVPKGTTNLKIDAPPNDANAKVKIEGNQNLKIGNNTVVITVTAEDGSKRTYTIDVYRSEQEGDNLLEDIIVDGYTLSPTFDPNKNEYEVNVGNIEDLDIKAIAKNKNAKVEIVGNKGLKEGRNLVQIKVTDENGFTKTYFLYVNKTAKKTFLGLTLGQWLTALGILLLAGLLIYIILLLKKKKEIKEEKKIEQKQVPVIEFKPEFNFGSKNGTDDDVVNEGGILNQYTGINPEKKEEPRIIETNTDNVKEIPYDPYDEIVTKDELFDAIEEARKTKDPTKFKMLYEQELLNRKKAELKAKEESQLK